LDAVQFADGLVRASLKAESGDDDITFSRNLVNVVGKSGSCRLVADTENIED